VNGFEGSFLGASDRIEPDAVLECGVCWWVYDPAKGDDAWQIPAGTAFTDLPVHWRCPNCDTEQEQFMVLHRGLESKHAQQRPAPLTAAREALRRRERELLEAYEEAAGRMRNLPVYNQSLDIQIIGLQPWKQGLLCVATTPWCMNILLLPAEDTPARMEGTTREVSFPSGNYSFTAGQLAGVGPIECCSLFSPMEQFDDPAVAGEVARHALKELLKEPEAPAMSRRGFLRGGRQTGERPQAR
jgi:[NiFe] hydrogenase assembly HybE family chaperone